MRDISTGLQLNDNIIYIYRRKTLSVCLFVRPLFTIRKLGRLAPNLAWELWGLRDVKFCLSLPVNKLSKPVLKWWGRTRSDRMSFEAVTEAEGFCRSRKVAGWS